MEAQTLESPQLERCTISQDKAVFNLDKRPYLDDLNVVGSSNSGVSELEKAVYALQQLLQKLYSELDEERESAATAASEALSMILRLQDEKALLMMEASQYKRMAEEKMCHAEEALAVFEDLTYEREMEIAALEFQLQAYRYRLLSMGVTDVGVSEVKYPENPLMQSMNSTNIQTLNNEIPIKDSELANETMKFVDLDSVTEGAPIQDNVDTEKKLSIDLNSYWDQIKKLDERIKELLGRHKTPLPKGITQEANASCSSGVQDIFEVPESLRKENQKLTMERDDRLMKPDIVTNEATELPIKNQKGRLRYPEKKSGKARSSNYSPEYQQLSRRIERLERARKQETVGSEMNLLKEISVQIKTLQSEMKSLRAKKSNVPIEPSLDPLQEAMLYFWL